MIGTWIYVHLEETAECCAEAIRLLGLHVLGQRQMLTAGSYDKLIRERTLVAEMFRFLRDSGYLLLEIWRLLPG